MRIDAHHHVWDLSVRPQVWMDGMSAYEPIARSFLVDEYVAVAEPSGIIASVVVQTVSEIDETVELLALASARPAIGAVVGWVDLTGNDVSEQLARLQAGVGGAALRGIRHQVHDEPDVRWICREHVGRGIAAVGAAGLVYDLLVRPEHLGPAIETVASLGEVMFVLDHGAKPQIAAGDHAEWSHDIRRLAALPNVMCKLSGLLTECSWTSWTVDDLRPYVETIVEAFGVERVMIGSDWPVSLLVAPFGETLQAIDAALPSLSDGERASLHFRTAARVYAIDL